MNLILERKHINQESTDGLLRNEDGTKICSTAEHTATSLPPGTYPVLIHRCKHYRRKMPLIMVDGLEFMAEGENPITHTPYTINQKCETCPKLSYVGNNSTLPCYCPMIKIGNGIHNRTDGSIIIGERITWGCMKHPVEHFNRLIDRLDKAQNRGESITLTIKEK